MSLSSAPQSASRRTSRPGGGCLAPVAVAAVAAVAAAAAAVGAAATAASLGYHRVLPRSTLRRLSMIYCAVSRGERLDISVRSRSPRVREVWLMRMRTALPFTREQLNGDVPNARRSSQLESDSLLRGGQWTHNEVVRLVTGQSAATTRLSCWLSIAHRSDEAHVPLTPLCITRAISVSYKG